MRERAPWRSPGPFSWGGVTRPFGRSDLGQKIVGEDVDDGLARLGSLDEEGERRRVGELVRVRKVWREVDQKGRSVDDCSGWPGCLNRLLTWNNDLGGRRFGVNVRWVRRRGRRTIRVGGAKGQGVGGEEEDEDDSEGEGDLGPTGTPEQGEGRHSGRTAGERVRV